MSNSRPDNDTLVRCAYLNKKIFDDQPNTVNGLAAGVYSFNDKPNEIYIVYRGSNEPICWLEHNVDIAKKQNPSIVSEAILFAREVKKKYPDKDIITTGFSKGAVLAIESGLADGSKVVAIDAPGYFGGAPDDRAKNIHVYQSRPNVVNKNAGNSLEYFNLSQVELTPETEKKYDQYNAYNSVLPGGLVQWAISELLQTTTAHNINNIYDGACSQYFAEDDNKKSSMESGMKLLALVDTSYFKEKGEGNSENIVNWCEAQPPEHTDSSETKKTPESLEEAHKKEIRAFNRRREKERDRVLKEHDDKNKALRANDNARREENCDERDKKKQALYAQHETEERDFFKARSKVWDDHREWSKQRRGELSEWFRNHPNEVNEYNDRQRRIVAEIGEKGKAITQEWGNEREPLWVSHGSKHKGVELYEKQQGDLNKIDSDFDSKEFIRYKEWHDLHESIEKEYAEALQKFWLEWGDDKSAENFDLNQGTKAKRLRKKHKLELDELFTKPFLKNTAFFNDLFKMFLQASAQIDETSEAAESNNFELPDDLGLDELIAVAKIARAFGQPDMAHQALTRALKIEPGSADTLIEWAKVGIELNMPKESILSTLSMHRRLISGQRELNIIDFYSACAQEDTSLLAKAFDSFASTPDSAESISYMCNALTKIDGIDRTRNEVDMYLADQSVVDRLHTERHITLLAAMCNQHQSLCERLKVETDPAIKAELSQLILNAELEREQQLERAAEILSYEKNSESLLSLYNANYMHLAYDMCLRLFTKPIMRLTGLRLDELSQASQIVEHAFNFAKDRLSHDDRQLFEELSKKLRQQDVPTDEINKLRVCMESAPCQGYITTFNAYLNTISSHGLKLKIGIAIADLLLLKQYNNYAEQLRNTPSENPLDYRAKDPISYDKWIKSSKNRNAAQTCITTVKYLLDALAIAQALLTIISLPYSNDNLISKVRKFATSILMLPRLALYLHAMASPEYSESGKNSNWCYAWLSCLVDSMGGNNIQQFVSIHEDTILHAIVDILKRSGDYSGASFVISMIADFRKSYLPHIQNIHFILNLGYSVNKWIPNLMEEQKRVNHIHSLEDELATIKADLARSTNEDDAEAKRKAVLSYQSAKNVANDYGGTHSKRYHLYALSMFSQHQIAGDNESVSYNGDGNGFFKAVACYTKQDPAQLRELAVKYIDTHRSIFEGFLTISIADYLLQLAKDKTVADELVLRALCLVLNRPILIAFDGSDLDFKRQGLQDGGTILPGEPIFVGYDAPNERYNGLRLRGEWYFERQLSEKLASSSSHDPVKPVSPDQDEVSQLEKELATLMVDTQSDTQDLDSHSLEELEKEFYAISGIKI